MRFAIALSFVLSSLVAQAAPQIGDTVNYNVIMTSNGSVKTGTITYQFTAYDARKDEWTQFGERILDGKVENQERKVPGKQIISDRNIQSLLQRCKKNGGKSETLHIASGPINTCKLPTAGGLIWMGDVPMMRVVKMKISKGDTETETTLTSFARGQ